MPRLVPLAHGLYEWLWRQAGGLVVETACRRPAHLLLPGWPPLVALPRGWRGAAREAAFAAALAALRLEHDGVHDCLRETAEAVAWLTNLVA